MKDIETRLEQIAVALKEKVVETQLKKSKAKEEHGKADNALNIKAIEARLRIVEKYLGLTDE